jgi:hypothetical protein
LNIPIMLSLNNNLINEITDRRISKTFSATYYFTNEDVITPKTFPYLTAAIPVFNAEYVYEHGELYTNDQNKVCLFYVSGDGTSSLLPVNGNDYANSNDELIVPLQFTYRFNEADNVTNANFSLNDSNGNIIRSYEFKSDTALNNIAINFNYNQSANLNTPLTNINILPGSSVTEENIYTLKVEVNNTKNYHYKLMFYEPDDATIPCWAIISIRPKVANADFSIYDENGLIKYKKNQDGSENTPTTVFKICMKSRSAFWRYINDSNKDQKLKNNYTDFLKLLNNKLVTKLPRPITYSITPFGNTPFTYLPNPESNEIKIEERRIYTDIRVPNSDMFAIDSS